MSTDPPGHVSLDILPVVRDGTHLVRGKLSPNTWYQTGEHEYLYRTNEHGHIDRVIAEELHFKTHEGRLRHDPNTLGKIQDVDNAGHLFADWFGGSPKLDNLVPMLEGHNKGRYLELERRWAGALSTDPPGHVGVDIRVDTNPTTGRPTRLVVRSTIDGERDIAVFKQQGVSVAKSEQEIIRGLIESWVPLGLEYTQDAPNVSTLFIHAGSENGAMRANIFFEQDGQVLYPGKLDGAPADPDAVFRMQEILLEDLVNAESAFEEAGIPCPTEYRITYEPGPGRLDVQLSHEIKYANHPTKILQDGPEDWLDGRLEKHYGRLTPTDEQRREWQ